VIAGAPAVTITVLDDRGDLRGRSYSVSPHWSRFLPSARDIHLTTLKPGHTRGNHFHARRREVILVLHASDWTLRWDTGAGTTAHERRFPGAGAVLLTVEPGAAHAVMNSGTADLITVGIGETPFDPADPDTQPRRLPPPPA